jgi:hypothetical protein
MILEMLVLVAYFSGACAFFSMHVADVKGYNVAVWLFLGAAFNIVALVAIAGMPVKK